ncbi:hypothetical protein [Sphingomonas aquatica]|uniref:hypothetical protein n=2 Tax=Sphingomonas TaxID=13687 RepID=UPI001454C6AA
MLMPLIMFFTRLALGWGLPSWASKAFGYIVPILGAIAVVLGAWAFFASHYEHNGAAKNQAKVEKAHTARVIEARADERAAQATSDAIGRGVARDNAASTEFTRTKVSEIHDVIAKLPPAPAGALPPAAPVGELRDHVNAVVDRANRAAEAADARP